MAVRRSRGRCPAGKHGGQARRVVFEEDLSVVDGSPDDIFCLAGCKSTHTIPEEPKNSSAGQSKLQSTADPLWFLTWTKLPDAHTFNIGR